MGEIIATGLLSHAPTIMMPKEIRHELNEGKEISLVPGLESLRTEVLDHLKFDTVIVLDTHWYTTWEFVVTGHRKRAGLYTSEELPRVMHDVPYDLVGDPDLAENIAKCVRDNGTRCIASDEPNLPIHYATVNLAHYLNRGERWLSVGVCQTAKDHNFLKVGEGIRKAVEISDNKVVILASGGLSHRFWPFDDLELHEASDPIHIRTPEARMEDEKRLAWFKQGFHDKVIDNMDDYLIHRPEGRFGHYLMMVAAIGGHACKAKGRLYSDYENATGTGQVHVWFDKPEAGWVH